MRKTKRLLDEYRFLGFRPNAKIKGKFGDSRARIILLERRQKKRHVASCGTIHRSYYDRKTRLVRDLSCGIKRIYLEVEIRRVKCDQCGKVKQEKLSWIADNPWYTKRFAFLVGRRCKSSTVWDVAKAFRLDWETVKELDKQYMCAQLNRFGTPAPRVIGIDEISIKKGLITG